MKVYAIKVMDIDDKTIHRLCSYIDVSKRYKIERYINKKDKVRSLIGEIIIRNLIIQNLGLSNKDIVFSFNIYGKPYIEKNNFSFNISHSGEFVLCAIDDEPVGIDVEEIKKIQYIDIAEKNFTEKEFNYILKRGLEPCIFKFYKIWTLKESYIKFCGQGLTIPLRSFSIENDGNNKFIHKNKDGQIKEKFKIYDGELNYMISVCSRKSIFPDKITLLNQDLEIEKFIKANRDKYYY